jgi:hypothetical protein
MTIAVIRALFRENAFEAIGSTASEQDAPACLQIACPIPLNGWNAEGGSNQNIATDAARGVPTMIAGEGRCRYNGA